MCVCVYIALLLIKYLNMGIAIPYIVPHQAPTPFIILDPRSTPRSYYIDAINYQLSTTEYMLHQVTTHGSLGT